MALLKSMFSLAMLESAISFVVVFAILVVFHELGHFLAARAFKMPILEFAVGFGPKIVTIARQGILEYTLRLYPLGGFVKIRGMEIEEEAGDSEEKAAVDEDSFNKRPVHQRFAVILAGPLASLLVGYLGYVLLFAVYGKPSMTAQIGQVMPGKPAAIAGLRAGDKVVSIDGKAVTIDTLVPTIDASKGSPMDFLVADDTKAERHVVVKAEKDSTGGKDVYRIGVRPTFVFEPCSFGVAWIEAASTTAQYGSKLVSIVKAGKTKDAVGGPVGIAQTFYALAGTGAQTRIELLASLSLSLFIFNMFPIPILDGGHLVLLTIEAIRRKKLSAINMQRVYLAGAAIMGLLFLTIMWNDVVKLIAPK